MDYQNSNNRHIAFVCDNNYALQLGIAINSIIQNNNTDILNFHIIEDNISSTNKNKLQEIVSHYEHKLIFNNVHSITQSSELLQLLNHNREYKKYISKVALAKFFIPLLPNIADTIIYLDCDTMNFGSLSYLWNIDLSEYLIAAVPDLRLTNSKYNNSIGFTSNDIYFNSGLMIFNVRKYIDDKIFPKAINLLKSTSNSQDSNRFVDQDHFNILFKNSIRPLPLEYNIFSKLPVMGEAGADIREAISTKHFHKYISSYYSVQDLIKAVNDPKIVHFVTIFKPWNSRIGYKFSEWKKAAIRSPWRNQSTPKTILRKRLYLMYLSSIFKCIHLLLSVFNKAKYLLAATKQ